MSSSKPFFKRLISVVLIVTMLMSVLTVGVSFSASAAGDTKTLYFSSNGYWSKLFAVYAWGDSYDSGTWYALNAVGGKTDIYSADVPADYGNAVFCSREIPAADWDAVVNQTESLTIPADCNRLSLTSETTAVWSNYVPDDDNTSTQIIYFAPNEEWSNIQYSVSHDYVLRAFSAEDSEGVYIDMELVDGSYGIYPTIWMAEVEASYENVEFCRVEYTAEDSYTIWEKTNVQTVPENKNLFTQNADSATGTWSFTEAIEPTAPVVTEPATETETQPSTDSQEPDTEPSETTTIFFTANEAWTETVGSSIGRISAYAWNSATDEGTWYWLEDSYFVEAQYSVDINSEYDSILFGVSYSDTPDSVWSQTDDLVIPENSNHFTQDSDDDATGTWSYIETSPSASNSYYVVFLDYDSRLISAQVVSEGEDASAPADPVRSGYTFIGWDKAFDNVTENLTITAKYEKNAAPEIPVVTTGKLQVEVAGGSGFTIAVNGGSKRPQGTSYLNTKMPRNASVTLVSSTTNDNAFIGWVNEAGAIVSLAETYSFVTSGNDYLRAVYQTNIDGVNLVSFKNTKAAGGNGQILDMQYYAAGDELVIPDDPKQTGYDFTGWNMTAEEIQAELAKGNDVTVDATWVRAIVYVTVTVNGGTVNGAESAQCAAYSAVTVVAGAAASGQKFAYWTNGKGQVVSYDAEYSFYPADDTVLTANYVASNDAIEYQAIVGLAADPTADGENITYTMNWDVPSSVGTVTLAGLMIVNAEDYSADTFYHGSGDSKLFDRALGSSQIKQKNTYAINKGASYYDNTYYACTWVIYTDAATGEAVTVYSDMVEVTKLG